MLAVMEKYTAIYPRVSTHKQSEHGTSLDYQEEVCLIKAKELNVPNHLIKVYREEGESGEDIDRPKMNELREDIIKGLIDRIIIVHPDRLSRNMVDRLIVCAEFEKYNVELIFLDVEYKNSEEGRLFFNIQSSIAQYELALIKKRTRRGSIKSSEKGEIMGLRHAPYGYDYIEKQLYINKEEAQFVKKIFQWYVYDKLTMREIGERLLSEGAMPKRTKENIIKGKINKESKGIWSASTIQHILKNETYIGKYYYNRRATSKVKGERTKSGKPKRTYQVRDREDWIEINVPLIVDYATFSLAQEQREQNTKHSGNIKHEYLLRQKIRCGHCGNKFSSYTSSSTTKSKITGEITSRHTYSCYRCTNKQNRKFGEGVEKCPSKIIRADQLENHIWENILEIIYNPQKISNQMEEKHKKPSREIEEMHNLLKFKMAKLEEEKKRIGVLFRKGHMNEEEMDQEMLALDKGIKELRKEFEKYEQQMFNIGKNELNIKILNNQVKTMQSMIENKENIPFKMQRQIVDWFIDEIILKWEGDILTVITIGTIEAFTNEEQLRELSTKRQTVTDTNNIVFNLVFETKFLVNNGGRGVDYKVINQDLKIG